MKISKQDLDALYDRVNEKPKKNKYNAKKTVIDGIRFDSKKEGHRYRELKLQQKAGYISNLELQPEFVLQEKFKSHGKTIRKIVYKADFRYKKNGVIVVEDVKGFKKNPVYLIKKKLLLFKFPGINFVET